MVWVAAQHGDGVSEGLEPGVSTATARPPVRLRLAEGLYASWYITACNASFNNQCSFLKAPKRTVASECGFTLTDSSSIAGQ
jgi:hypothetical protein